MTVTESGSLAISPDILREKVEELAQLDEQLDAASGSESAGKRALGNSLAKDYEKDWKGDAESLIAEFNKIEDPEKLAGVYNGIVSAMHDNFREKVDEYLTSEVAKRNENREQVSPEQIQEWNEARKVLMDHYKALKEILVMILGED